MINEYVKTRYVPGGRGPYEFDCWGLVRDARTRLFGLPLLPTCASALPGHGGEITRSVRRVSHQNALVPAEIQEGAIATGWRGRVCLHVGLVVRVDGALRILETDRATGPCVTRVPRFESRFAKVIYYAN